MLPKKGDRYLVTTLDWFYGPDGESYKAVYGTVNGVYNDHETLGIKTNARSANWYLSIGNMLVAGCQIHYAVQTDAVSFEPPLREIECNGELKLPRVGTSRIYDADS